MADNEKKAPMAFVGACKDFFGFKPEQGLKDFADELKQLTPKDRADIQAGLEANGYIIRKD